MQYNQLLLTLLVVVSLFLNTGCPALFVGAAAGGAAGAGTVAYIGGELKSTEEVSFTRAWRATQKAMSNLEFQITDKRKDAFDAQLTATGAGGKKIMIALTKISDTRTEIRIRVGTFGDKSLSQKILATIKRQF